MFLKGIYLKYVSGVGTRRIMGISYTLEIKEHKGYQKTLHKGWAILSEYLQIRCKCCGTPWRVALGWVDVLLQEEVEKLYKIWGDATILRAIYQTGPPSMFGSKGFDDPIWEREWDLLREGREEYPDKTPGYFKAGEKGRKQLFKLAHMLMDQIAQEAGMYQIAE